eukprot:TRINITY_DN35931_c0_g1_i1.p1 TRINITY_DN35931_c0_g1~~TRINITY_DN35931_c0_g1_i1.p1  ORF type:complete len:297 (+),score=55.51 TRINITY_DN35931_c0_g1_i1:69-959(+)
MWFLVLLLLSLFIFADGVLLPEAQATSNSFSNNTRTSEPRFVVIAVSGTLEDGFELRHRLDYIDEKTGERVNATFLGLGLMRGAKMYFDAWPEWLSQPSRANPAILLTGDWCDANQYALYIVDERQVLTALLGEPRMLSMTPDSLLLQLDDSGTDPQVSRFARAVLGDAESECGIMAVVGTFKACSFLAAPPYETRSDCTRVTTFRASMAKFARITNISTVPPSSAEWNAAVGQALNATSPAVEHACKQPVPLESMHPSEAKAGLYGTPSTPRLSKAIGAAEVRRIADMIGISLQI